MKDLVDLVVVEVFNQAYSHRHDGEYFQDINQFRLWLNTVAIREALRLLLRNSRVEPWLRHLPATQCRLLGMVYLDRLPYGDVHSILRMSLDEVRQQSRIALHALFELVRQQE